MFTRLSAYLTSLSTMLSYFRMLSDNGSTEAWAVCCVLRDEQDRVTITMYNRRLEEKDTSLVLRPVDCECTGEPLCGIVSNFSEPVTKCLADSCPFHKNEHQQVLVA